MYERGTGGGGVGEVDWDWEGGGGVEGLDEWEGGVCGGVIGEGTCWRAFRGGVVCGSSFLECVKLR